MKVLLHPTYFPSISHWVAMTRATSIVFETEDHFQKQTNRNRMYIYSPNGKQLLTIPVKHSKNTPHQKYRDVQIENDFEWQKMHFKSLEVAYRNSPFFEYFEDDLVPLFKKKYSFLMDLNFETIHFISKALDMPFSFEKTTEYFREVQDTADMRWLTQGKKDTSDFEPYKQVFSEKYGYINNLSILDLLFNEGRYALEYLEQHPIRNILTGCCSL